MQDLIPILGILTGIIIPVSVFIWQYKEGKGKREVVLEISKNMDNPEKLERLLAIFDERKAEPVDYRRGGIITGAVGLGLYLFGNYFLANLLHGVGIFIGVIGLGVFIAGFLYPNTSEEITSAVEKFEQK